eukprot:4029737-Pyramimonas_sp.AAC.1
MRPGGGTAKALEHRSAGGISYALQCCSRGRRHSSILAQGILHYARKEVTRQISRRLSPDSEHPLTLQAVCVHVAGARRARPR